jgi:hypothetical protein
MILTSTNLECNQTKHCMEPDTLSGNKFLFLLLGIVFPHSPNCKRNLHTIKSQIHSQVLLHMHFVLNDSMKLPKLSEISEMRSGGGVN